MPGNFALLLCALFVLFLLRLDHQQAPRISLVTWLPTIWLLYCGSRPIAAWFSPDLLDTDYDIRSGSPIDRNFLIALIIPGLIILARRGIDWPKVLKDNLWILVLFLFAGISIVWSDAPWVSLKRWIKASGAVVMALLVLSEPAPRECLESILRRSMYILIPFSAVLVKYFTSIGVHYNRWTGESMWVGVTTQKNGLGRLCVVCSLYLLWVFLRRALGRDVLRKRTELWSHLLLLGLTLWLLIGCNSVTSMTVLAFGGMILAALLFAGDVRKQQLSHCLGAVMIMILCLTVYLFMNGTLPALGVSQVGRDTTFTGRTEIWAELFPFVWQKPIVGMGYGSFWIDPSLPFLGINEGHNGYLDVVLEIGFTGLLVLFIALFSFFSRLRGTLGYDSDWASFGLSFLLILMVHNLTETSFMRTTSHLWTVFVFLHVVLLGYRRRPAGNPASQPGRIIFGTASARVSRVGNTAG